MNDINVDTSSVLTTFSEVQAIYDEIAVLIGELNQKNEAVSDFWTSTEATKFVEQLNKVSTMFKAFSVEYSNFSTSLTNILKAYDSEESNIVDALNTYGGNNGE